MKDDKVYDYNPITDRFHEVGSKPKYTTETTSSYYKQIESNIIGHEFEDVTEPGKEIIQDVKRSITNGVNSGRISRENADYLLSELQQRILVGRERVKKREALASKKSEVISAKNSYKKKSFLWRLFNRKLSSEVDNEKGKTR